MNHYEKLGTLAIRWIAVGFFILAFITALFAGTMGTMGSMTGDGQGAMSGHMGEMMQGRAWMWWGPTLLNLVIGMLLYTLSRPVGRMMASGLE